MTEKITLDALQQLVAEEEEALAEKKATEDAYVKVCKSEVDHFEYYAVSHRAESAAENYRLARYTHLMAQAWYIAHKRRDMAYMIDGLPDKILNAPVRYKRVHDAVSDAFAHIKDFCGNVYFSGYQIEAIFGCEGYHVEVTLPVLLTDYSDNEKHIDREKVQQYANEPYVTRTLAEVRKDAESLISSAKAVHELRKAVDSAEESMRKAYRYPYLTYSNALYDAVFELKKYGK